MRKKKPYTASTEESHFWRQEFCFYFFLCSELTLLVYLSRKQTTSTGSSIQPPTQRPRPSNWDRQTNPQLCKESGLFSQDSPYQVLKYIFTEKEFYFTEVWYHTWSFFPRSKPAERVCRCSAGRLDNDAHRSLQWALLHCLRCTGYVISLPILN